MIDYLQARIRVVVGVCYGGLALIVVFALLVDRHHVHTAVEKALPVFWSLFGFCAAAAIIGIAYWYGRSGIQARPDYYDCPWKRGDSCDERDD